MSNFFMKRLAHSIFSLIGLLILVFFLARLTGDPTDLYLPLNASEEARIAFSKKYGFSDPLLIQFKNFIINIFRGDFGTSLLKQRPALEVVIESISITLWLAAITMIIAIIVSLVVGSIAACNPGGGFDRTASIISLTGASAPDFWIAITAIFLFSVGLGWLPTSGVGDFSIKYWIMPVGVLLIRPIGQLVQVVRGSMLTALSSPYVKTARAKGVQEFFVVFKHALRNALIPVITVAADRAAGIANGAVIVEVIFGWPGVGKLLIDSIQQRDFAVIQGAVLVTALVIFAINFIVDCAYAFLDPRIRNN